MAVVERWPFVEVPLYSVNFWLSYSPVSDIGILYRNNLVNKISEEPLWLGSWYLAYEYRLRCRWTDWILHLFLKFLVSYSPFSDTGSLYRNNLVIKISEEPLWLGSWYLAYCYRSRCRWTDYLLHLFRKFSVGLFLFPFFRYRHFV